MPGRDVFAPFSDFTSGPGIRDVSLPLPGLLGDGTGSIYRKGNMWGFDQDNGAITKQYVSFHKSISRLKEDTGMGQLLYAANPRMRQYEDTALQARSRKEQTRFAGVREPLEFKCLSRLARFLKSKEGRILYGNDRDCKRLRETWKFAGVQNTPVHDSLGDNDEFVMGLIVARRARIKDFTMAFGSRTAQMNDEIWVIWRRYEWTGVSLPTRVMPGRKDVMPLAREVGFKSPRMAIAAMDSDWGIPEDSDDDEKDEKRPAVEAKKREDALAARRTQVQRRIITAGVLKKAVVTRPGLVTDSGAKEYYWQPDIWFGPRGERPPERLYITDSFIGDAEQLALVLDLYGDRSQTVAMEAHAKEALHPTSDTDDWRKSLVQLPDLEVHLRIR